MRSSSAAPGCLPSDRRWCEFRMAEVQDLSPRRGDDRASCSISTIPRPRRRSARGLRRVGRLDDVLANSMPTGRDETAPWLLAPCDLQAIKASGVTFVASLLERVIEEQARGDAEQGGSRPAGHRRRHRRQPSGISSGLAAGDAAQGCADRAGRLVAVSRSRHRTGRGDLHQRRSRCPRWDRRADIGIHPKSQWNNPEPEIVLAVNSRGRIVGATLGNDVNLRDFEGRSALLLGKAKDNNASCAIGPFIRLFDDHFSWTTCADAMSRCTSKGRMASRSTARQFDVARSAATRSSSSSRRSGRIINIRTGDAVSRHHVRADDRSRSRRARASPTPSATSSTVSTPPGALVNRVNSHRPHCAVDFGAVALMNNLAQRGLLAAPSRIS